MHEGIRYACNLCNYQAPTKQSLKGHNQSIHNYNGTRFGCNQCKYNAKHKSSLRRHIKSHNQEYFEEDIKEECRYDTNKDDIDVKLEYFEADTKEEKMDNH